VATSFITPSFGITIMPQWMQKLFGRTDYAPSATHGDYDPDWAEFNLPAGDDLRSLLGKRVAPYVQPPNHEHP
jgi:hypothetical protein